MYVKFHRQQQHADVKLSAGLAESDGTSPVTNSDTWAQMNTACGLWMWSYFHNPGLQHSEKL